MTATTFRAPPGRGRPLRAALTALALTALTLGRLRAAGRSAADSGTVTYWLWDANQLPAYQACAKAFEKQNPGLQVEDHPVRLGRLLDQAHGELHRGHPAGRLHRPRREVRRSSPTWVLEPLDELGPTRASRTSDYQPGLAELWIGQDGHRYGAPKDWDTVALFYNKKMTKAAGSQRRRARRPGLEPAGRRHLREGHRPPDRRRERQARRRAGLRQEQRRDLRPGHQRRRWRRPTARPSGVAFTGSAGWKLHRQEPVGQRTTTTTSKPSSRTIEWYFGLAEKGYMAPLRGLLRHPTSPETQLGSGKAAIALHGSWMISARSPASRAWTSASRPPRRARPASAPR